MTPGMIIFGTAAVAAVHIGAIVTDRYLLAMSTLGLLAAIVLASAFSVG